MLAICADVDGVGLEESDEELYEARDLSSSPSEYLLLSASELKSDSEEREDLLRPREDLTWEPLPPPERRQSQLLLSRQAFFS